MSSGPEGPMSMYIDRTTSGKFEIENVKEKVKEKRRVDRLRHYKSITLLS